MWGIQGANMAGMFRVLVGWTDRSASGLLRAVQPLRFLSQRLKDRGVDASLQPSPAYDDRAGAAVVLRALSDQGALWAVNLKSKGARIVINLDDDLWRIPPGSPAHRGDTRDTLLRSLYLADFVWASTEYLAERVRQEGWTGPLRVLPNLLDAAAYPERRPPDPADPVRVLWHGSETHRGDLKVLADGLGGLFDRLVGRAELCLWGDADPELARRHWGRNMKLLKWSAVEEFSSRLVALRPDVCLCPLDQGEPFNRSKSGIKFFESSLAGAACVCSDLEPYSAVVRDGETGLLARRPHEWEDDVEHLVTDAEFREVIARAAREDVLLNHTWQNSPAARAWEDAFAELKG